MGWDGMGGRWCCSRLGGESWLGEIRVSRDLLRDGKIPSDPHPDPLPEYRARGKEGIAGPLAGDFHRERGFPSGGGTDDRE